MSPVRTGASVSALDRDHVGRGDVDHVTALGAHPQRRTHLEQMADDVGQRRHGAGGQPVAQADPGADRRAVVHRQCPNGSGSSPGIQVNPGTPQPCDLTERLAARACRPIRPST